MANKNYKNRLESLKARRQDVITKAFSVTEGFNLNKYGDNITYVLESMEEINPEYTNNTYKACEKVQGHIKSGLAEKGIDVHFRYQGSVPTNTHIKNYSDIDLLVINQEFITLQPPQKPSIPYAGEPVSELKEMRKHIYTILDTVYSTTKIDDSGSKAINISGGSLNRSIDIVPSNWYNSVKYVETNDEDYRGVNILDRDNSTRITNYPFMHIYWINNKDNETKGNLKKLIRFIKTLKVDADEKIDVSSYDIASILFRMDNNSLLVPVHKPLLLLQNCNKYFIEIINNVELRDNLMVANGTRKIFCDEGTKLDQFKKLQKELSEIIEDIVADIKPLYENLEKAEINYRLK